MAWLTLRILSFLTIPLCFKMSPMKKGSNGTRVSGSAETGIPCTPTHLALHTTPYAHPSTSPWLWERRRKRMHSPSDHPLPCQWFRPSPHTPVLNRGSESQSSFSIHSTQFQTLMREKWISDFVCKPQVNVPESKYEIFVSPSWVTMMSRT